MDILEELKDQLPDDRFEKVVYRDENDNSCEKIAKLLVD